jgi:antitoxin component YwqK of YwqJK toxin-antitoxin module
MTPIIPKFSQILKNLTARKSVLLILLFVFGSAKYSQAKVKTLEELKKETLYIVVPQDWDTSAIHKIFGKNYKKLDTNSPAINSEVHRIGIDIACIDKLSFIAKHNPNVQQLLIHNLKNVDVEGINDFKNLRSLSNGDLAGSGPRYVADDMPMEFDYRLPSMLIELPLLEEIGISPYAGYSYSAYFPQKMNNYQVIKDIEGPVILMPLFLLQKNADEKIEMDLFNHPYPELVALSYSGYEVASTSKDKKYQWNLLDYIYDSNNPILNAEYYSEFPDSLPFWFKGCKSKRKPQMKSLPKNGFYCTKYYNGNSIISGNMVDGQPDGEWKLWYANGIPCETRHYKNGAEDGKWFCFNEKGDTTYIFDFKNEKLSRMQEIHYDSSLFNPRNGSCFMIKNISDYNLDQRTTIFRTVEYKKNDPKDSLIYYTTRYNMENGMSYKESKAYYRNQLISTVINYEKREPYPSNVFYKEEQKLDNEGKLKKRWIYTNQFELDSMWFANGNLHSVELTTWSPNVFRQHTFSFWDSSGYLESKKVYRGRDTLDGQCTFYYKNGNVKMISDYQEGKLDGQTILFDESGKKKEFWSYENGVLESISTYNEVGKQTGAKIYENGVLVKEYRYH